MMTDQEKTPEQIREYRSLSERLNQISGKLNALTGAGNEENDGRWLDVFREREFYRDFPADEERLPDFKDDFVRENGLRPGLIKVDVEGAEQQFLAGARETIRTMKPALLISIYHNGDDFFSIKPMLEELNPDYRFRIRHPAIGTVLMETMLIAEMV